MEPVRDTFSPSPLRVRRRAAVECAQCGDAIDIPEWSEALDGGRIRHLWTCDRCGYVFETTIRFAA